MVNLRTGLEVNGQLHTQNTLATGKDTQYPLNNRLDAPPHTHPPPRPKEEKNFLPLSEIEPPIIQPTAQSIIPTTLYQLPSNQTVL
jgi:hypothetical protein